MPTRDSAPIGAPCWVDLMTSDTERSREFYCRLFGWSAEAPAEEFGGYVNFTRDGEGLLAGIMDASGFLPEGVPAHWSVYFGVDDADAALAKIGELGGSTVLAAEDTPYGRLATAVDPTGAQFKLVAPNEAMPAN